MSRRFSDFLIVSWFFDSKNCSGSVLSKNWWLCTVLAASCIQIVPNRLLYLSGRQSLAIVPAWLQSRLTWIKSMGICLWLAAKQVQFACDWRSPGYNLNASGCQVACNSCMQLAGRKESNIKFWSNINWYRKYLISLPAFS